MGDTEFKKTFHVFLTERQLFGRNNTVTVTFTAFYARQLIRGVHPRGGGMTQSGHDQRAYYIYQSTFLLCSFVLDCTNLQFTITSCRPIVYFRILGLQSTLLSLLYILRQACVCMYLRSETVTLLIRITNSESCCVL